MSIIGTKTPQEVKDYSFDWSKDMSSDIIAGPSNSIWSISPATANIASSAVSSSGTVTTIWVADGVPGNVYSIRNTIITSAGREMTKTFRILVVADNYM